LEKFFFNCFFTIATRICRLMYFRFHEKALDHPCFDFRLEWTLRFGSRYDTQ
jgi:hypothetical protein